MGIVSANENDANIGISLTSCETAGLEADKIYQTVHSETRRLAESGAWSSVEALLGGMDPPQEAVHRAWWWFARGISATFR